MGSSYPSELQLSAVSLGETYSGGESDVFDVTSYDYMTLIFDVTTESGVSAMDIKFQLEPDGVDLYKPGDSGLELDTQQIALAASTANQTFAIRLDTKGINQFRAVSKLVGGDGTINSIKGSFEGSATSTPPIRS